MAALGDSGSVESPELAAHPMATSNGDSRVRARRPTERTGIEARVGNMSRLYTI
jgi:hypothetical protein